MAVNLINSEEIEVSQTGSDIQLELTGKTGNLVVDSIRTKNMFDKTTLVQNDIIDMYPNLRITSRQIIWLEPGTYTASTNMSSSYQWGIQIQNVGIPPLSTYPTYIYTTNWLTAGTTKHTFTINTAGWFTLMARRSDNGSFTSTDITNIKSFNYQLETGSNATTYYPYQNVKNDWEAVDYTNYISFANNVSTINRAEALKNGNMIYFSYDIIGTFNAHYTVIGNLKIPAIITCWGSARFTKSADNLNYPASIQATSTDLILYTDTTGTKSSGAIFIIL